jgi:hypothetical protein
MIQVAISHHREIRVPDVAYCSCPLQFPIPETLMTSCDQQSWSFLDLTVQIQSRFRISRNRGFLLHCVLALLNSRSPKLRYRLGSMVLIISGSDNLDSIAISHIAKSRISCCIVFLYPFDIAIRETPMWSLINGPGAILTQLTTIVSRYRISRFRHFCCQLILTFQCSDPRNSNKG